MHSLGLIRENAGMAGMAGWPSRRQKSDRSSMSHR